MVFEYDLWLPPCTALFNVYFNTSAVYCDANLISEREMDSRKANSPYRQWCCMLRYLKWHLSSMRGIWFRVQSHSANVEHLTWKFFNLPTVDGSRILDHALPTGSETRELIWGNQKPLTKKPKDNKICKNSFLGDFQEYIPPTVPCGCHLSPNSRQIPPYSHLDKMPQQGYGFI